MPRRTAMCPPAALLCLLAVSLLPPAARAEDVALARHLALSPDGQTLAFSWMDDIWTVPASGGTATRLTVHPAEDSHPVWSRDGRQIAFASRRHGAASVFVMQADGTEVRRLTYADRSEVPTDWSADGRWIYFHALREGEAYNEARLYRVPVGGGQVWRVLDCFGNQACERPDGRQLVFTRGGVPWELPYRRGYRGSGNTDLYVYDRDSAAFTRLTEHPGNDKAPAWDAGGRGVYFLSDRDGPVNVWYQPLGGGPAEPVTRMTGDDVRALAVSADGRTLAFAQWDQVYVMSTADRRARVVHIAAADDQPETDVELRTITNDADEYEASPDGKEIALVVRGELFVIKTEEDKLTRRVTAGPARDRDVTWSPDGKALFFVSDREGQEDLYRARSAEDPPQPLSDSHRFEIERVTDDPRSEYGPQLSPDGKELAFVRERGDLIVRDLRSGQERCLLPSWDRPSFRWSPDGRWIAYAVEDREHNSDVWIVPADGHSKALNISQHPDYDGGPQWSADGQILAFSSQRQGFDTDLYVVFLARELDQKSAVELDEYFEKCDEAVKKRKPPESAIASGEIVLGTPAATAPPAESQPAESQPASQPTETQPVETQPTASAPASTPAAESQPTGDDDPLHAKVRGWVKQLVEELEKKPDRKKDKEKDKEKAEDEAAAKYAFALESAYRRVRRVTSIPGDQRGFALAPDGRLLAFISGHEGEPKVYTIKWNGEDRKSIIGGRADGLSWALDGKRLFYLKGGVPGSCSASGSDSKSYKFRAKMAIARAEEAAQKFADGARHVGTAFYHPTMKGLDWTALTRKYSELALRTRTIPEFNEVFNMLLGELNGSHLGIYGPRDGGQERIGYLGCSFDAAFAGPGLRVAAVLRDSPSDRVESRLVVGDVLLKINGQPVGPDHAVEAALVDAVSDEVIIEYLPAPGRAAAAETQPASAPASAPAGTAAPASAPASTSAPAESRPAPRELIIRPVSFGTIADLQYQAWVRSNKEYVDQQSGGRVGYLHIRGMGEAEFDVFERDLYAAASGRDGLIVDVRSNGGGWTADWVLAVLTVQRHAFTVPRGGEPGYPQDRLIFYAWTKPATMLCNHQSFSNAEIVSHAFKTLRRGPLVGTATYGGVISTGSYRLIDGAIVRMPGRGWYTLPDGIDMENHGAEPDLDVPVTPEDEVAGRRPQLDAAIRATLTQIEEQGGKP